MHGLHRGDGARWFSCGFEVIGSADPAFRAVCDTCTQAFLRPRQSAQRDSATVRQPSGPGRTLPQLIAALEARADKLDMIYRFPALVSPRGVLPPVITEARDAVQVTGDQLRVADRIYRMVARARFVTTPPSWRDDLFVGLRT